MIDEKRGPPDALHNAMAAHWAQQIAEADRKASRADAAAAAPKSPAWFGGLDADQQCVVLCPAGYRFSLILIALTKRALRDARMSAGERLRTLEALNAMTDAYLTPAMLAVIEPMGDLELKMLEEAASLDQRQPGPLRPASSAMLTRYDVFMHFVRLNPSLLDAIRMTAALTIGEAA